MITMDFKGITWVGNVYQKFEAMCLEVEEVMYQDTVKYVENQVQTVGASVKKFYSEVMQDVLPPSSIDPVKVAAADLSLNPYADFGINKKPKANIKKYTVQISKQAADDVKVKAEVNEKCASAVGGFLIADNLQAQSRSELFLEQNGHGGSYEKSNGVIRRKSRREDHVPSEISRSITPLSKDLSRVTSCCEMGENYDVPVKGSDTSRMEDLENITSSNVSTDDALKDIRQIDVILPSESGADKERQLRHIFNKGPFTDDGVDSLIGSYISCDPKNDKSSCEDFLSPTGDCNVDLNESDNDIFEPRTEAIQEFGQLNCVVVDRENISVVAHKEDKTRSYKKKIQKAFSSKRSARKQEYKQLAVEHGCMGIGPSQEIADSLMPNLELNEKRSPSHRISESEWELL